MNNTSHNFPISVDMPVYGIPEGNLARYNRNAIYAGVITKIARTYFYVKFETGLWGTVKFTIKDFASCCDDCNSRIFLFPTEAAAKDHILAESQLSAIRQAFVYGCTTPPRECINQIWSLLRVHNLVPAIPEKE